MKTIFIAAAPSLDEVFKEGAIITADLLKKAYDQFTEDKVIEYYMEKGLVFDAIDPKSLEIVHFSMSDSVESLCSGLPAISIDEKSGLLCLHSLMDQQGSVGENVVCCKKAKIRT